MNEEYVVFIDQPNQRLRLLTCNGKAHDLYGFRSLTSEHRASFIHSKQECTDLINKHKLKYPESTLSVHTLGEAMVCDIYPAQDDHEIISEVEVPADFKLLTMVESTCKLKEALETIPDMDTLSRQLATLEKQSQDVLHYIERENFNVVRGYKLAAKLRGIRKQRRVVKNLITLRQTQDLASVCKALDSISKWNNTDYTDRTEVMKGVD